MVVVWLVRYDWDESSFATGSTMGSGLEAVKDWMDVWMVWLMGRDTAWGTGSDGSGTPLGHWWKLYCTVLS